MTELEQLVKELPPDLQQEVRDFVEFLLAKQRRPVAAPLKLGWRGALRGWRERLSSVELQHQALEVLAAQREADSADSPQESA